VNYPGYAAMFQILAAVIGAVAVGALLVSLPAPARSAQVEVNPEMSS
jgi:hypothetical protein